MEPSKHSRRGRAVVRWAIALLGVAMLAAAPVQSDVRNATSSSAGSVAELVKLMGDRQLSAIAAQDPTEPARYIAAMHFPGVQLLVITARTHSPEYIDAQLTAKAYSNVYAALQQGIPESKLFIQDMGGDGLRGADGGTADIIYERGKDTRVINGNHESAGVSKSEYAKLVKDLDGKYDRLLRVLIQSAHGSTAAAHLPTSL